MIKNIIVVALMAIGLTSTSYADNPIGPNTIIENETKTLGQEIMDSYIYHEVTPYDDLLLSWFDNAKDLYASGNVFYQDSEEVINKLVDIFHIRFGYSNKLNLAKIRLKYSDGSISYGVKFRSDTNVDEAMREIRDAFNRTKELSAAVKGSSAEETADNAMTWIYTNIAYPYEALNMTWQESSEFITGDPNGTPQICEGRGILFTRLLYMNGIKVENAHGSIPMGAHWWNRVYTDNGPIWYDSTSNKKSVVLPDTYVLTEFSEFSAPAVSEIN